MSKLFLAVFVGILAIAPAAAQHNSAEDLERMVRSVETADLAKAVGDLAHAVEDYDRTGERKVQAKTGAGTVFVLEGTACDLEGVSGCQGIRAYAVFDMPEGKNGSDFATLAMQYPMVSFVPVAQGNRLVLMRYLALDNGVTYGNLLTNLVIFTNVLEPIARVIYDKPAQ